MGYSLLSGDESRNTIYGIYFHVRLVEISYL
ncbi:unnamed protein product, partial [marine sediment metagenome]